MKNDSKYAVIIIMTMAIVLTVFTIYSNLIPFNDTDEYIIIAKYIAGITNIKVFALHSTLYPFIASPFILAFRSLLSFQLLTVAFSILIGIVIWFASKDIKAVVLWAFSSVTWYAIASVGSIIPAALTLLLAYSFYEYWIKKGKLYLLALSGFCLGLSSAFYEGSWPVSVLFILIFFFRKKFSSMFLFLIFAIIGFSARFGTDYIVLGSALSSTMRMGFANLYVILGLHPENHVNITISRLIEGLLIVSPLLILSYRLLKKSKEEFLFVFISFIIIGLVTPSVKYLYLVMPIFLLLLSKIVTWKEITLHILLAIPLIIIITNAHISSEIWDYSRLSQDVKDIENDYSGMILVDKDLELIVASKAWNPNIYFIWLDDYLASKEGTNILKEYDYSEPIKGEQYSKLFFAMGHKRVIENTYPDNLPFIVRDYMQPSLEGYVPEKCYRELCVYRKSI